MSGPPAGIRVRRVDSITGRELRIAVLRPGQDPDEPMYPRERDAATLHFAALDEDGAVLALGSALPEAHPRRPRAGDWRVRAMATDPAWRGRGLGTRVLGSLEAAARERGAARLWCNARVPARAFYERAGFAAEGEEFEIAGIGLHCLMSKQL